MEIAPGVYWLDLGVSNCYLIAEDNQLTLVDAGVKRSARHILEFIQKLGYSPDQLTAVLLTHADIDHVGSVNPLRADYSLNFFASQKAAEALARGHSSRKIKAGLFSPLFTWFEALGGAMKIAVDEQIAESNTLPLLGGLEVLETPGHTPGHISFYAPRHKLLFAGDSVSTRPDQVLPNQTKMFNWDQEKMLDSVRRQQELAPEIVCSGHGPVVFKAAGKFQLNGD
jgi:glyoxylase-like metal-dependent hydrolase (beta-lactamase superfamily II)